jgi:2,3-bisphosphoglycerate-dependent phosphoglycerate mutase
MHRRTTIYLVRHAESQPSSEVPEPEWPLSTRGAKQARALVSSLRGLGAAAIYASPYLRAVQTVEPLAIALGMDVALIEALRERALGRVDLGADHAVLVERYWADPDFALPAEQR